jgi:hypothetical protein
MGSSNDQFDKYNNEIYDGLKHYASKESCSSSDTLEYPAFVYEPFKTEEDCNKVTNNTE